MAIQGLPGAGVMFPQGPLPLGGAQDTVAFKGDPALPGVGPAGEALLHNRPLARQQLAENPEARARFSRATGGASPNQAIVIDARNAIEILAGLLEAYGRSRMEEAEKKARINQIVSGDIAKANLNWARAKGTYNAKGAVDHEKPWRQIGGAARIKQQSNSQYPDNEDWYFFAPQEEAYVHMHEALTRLRLMSPSSDVCIPECDDGDIPKDAYNTTFTRKQMMYTLFPGGKYVSFSNPQYGEDHFKISANDLREGSAIMTALTDGFQVEVDKRNQEFKNCMTLLNSTREELKDLRRELLSLGKR